MRRSSNRLCGVAIVAALAVGGLALVAEAATTTITDFGGFNAINSSSTNNNGVGAGGAAFMSSNTVLQLTTLDTVGNPPSPPGYDLEANSTFYASQVPISYWHASFVYQESPGAFSFVNTPADGIAFVIQTAGTTALGGYGGALGYASGNKMGGGTASAISPSVAVELNIFTTPAGPNAYGPGTNLVANGGWGTYNATTPNFAPAYGPGQTASPSDHILVTLSYDGGAKTLSETLFDQDTATTIYSNVYNTASVAVPGTPGTPLSADIASIVGGTSAYVGFTGADGASTSTQTISDFQFTGSDSPVVPLPPAAWSSLILLGGLGAVQMTRRALA